MLHRALFYVKKKTQKQIADRIKRTKQMCRKDWLGEDHREADEEHLGRQVTRSAYLWRAEWEWTAVGGRGRTGGAARSRDLRQL